MYPILKKNLPNESFDEFLKEAVSRKMVLPVLRVRKYLLDMYAQLQGTENLLSITIIQKTFSSFHKELEESATIL